jgi:hypothetical protein
MKNFSDLKYAFYNYRKCVSIFFKQIVPKCDQSEMIDAIMEMFNELIIELPETYGDPEDCEDSLNALVIKITVHNSRIYYYGKQHSTHVFNVTIHCRQALMSLIYSLRDIIQCDTDITIDKFIYYTEDKIFMPYVEQECGYTLIELDRNPKL